MTSARTLLPIRRIAFTASTAPTAVARQSRLGLRHAHSHTQPNGEAPVPTTSGKIKDAPALLAIGGLGLLLGGGLIHFSARPKGQQESSAGGQLDSTAEKISLKK
ncbi:uncharacterized protein CTRU02_211343 [Colletotrichum truncatum]|uniref:Uncharacterized protein n=1 Tax=Colletotrichum truncatum TaxID=5467 RepID=A0ACC3YRH5_COLTU|nr:uncharacterized protein CTRU02_02120 [Colletotrichum truncatum]KAF6799249.1 hypothetical protein CTRU02_02120 [Colletotrichum truncatum]